jgi:hypothetical protein
MLSRHRVCGPFAPIKQMQLMKFDGHAWSLFGEVISGSGS